MGWAKHQWIEMDTEQRMADRWVKLYESASERASELERTNKQLENRIRQLELEVVEWKARVADWKALAAGRTI